MVNVKFKMKQGKRARYVNTLNYTINKSNYFTSLQSQINKNGKCKIKKIKRWIKLKTFYKHFMDEYISALNFVRVWYMIPRSCYECSITPPNHSVLLQICFRIQHELDLRLSKHFKFVQVMTREACTSNFDHPEYKRCSWANKQVV